MVSAKSLFLVAFCGATYALPVAPNGAVEYACYRFQQVVTEANEC